MMNDIAGRVASSNQGPEMSAVKAGENFRHPIRQDLREVFTELHARVQQVVAMGRVDDPDRRPRVPVQAGRGTPCWHDVRSRPPPPLPHHIE